MIKRELIYLEDKWDNSYADKLDEPEKLRYRSNLLGSDLRITNFGGGNTSSKILIKDDILEKDVNVLWVKGSGGDLGSIKRDGFATLYMDKFLALDNKYQGVKSEDDMLSFYPLCTFGNNSRPASIDTPLHGLIPYKNVDHMHPDWAIAIAASANGQELLKEFNQKYGYHLTWLPWQRPGYHLGTMLKKAIEENPDAEGMIMGSHGLINWKDDHYECYRHTLEIIDAMGDFVLNHVNKIGDKLFGGEKYSALPKRSEIAQQISPIIRGGVSVEKNFIGHYSDLSEVLRFVNSIDGEEMAFMGTSCPDHFIRTKVRPMYVDWNPKNSDLNELETAIKKGFEKYNNDYKEYYESNKEKDSPNIRGANPTVVLVPGIGMFTFGKNKMEARITAEFYINAIHVMEGATSMGSGKIDPDLDVNRVKNNYVALATKEAFNIEYWALEEAKIQRQPKEKELARKVVAVVGGGNGIGREFCSELLKNGAHIAVCDIDLSSAEATVEKLNQKFGSEVSVPVYINITDRDSIRNAYRKIAMEFGGLDILINTAAVFIPPDGEGQSYKDETWAKTLNINVTSNFILVEEFAKIIQEQNSRGTVLLTSSANAVVPKFGSEPYDVSKAALSHLIRELAVKYAPTIRVNGISPATVIEGSTMFPRDRVIKSLEKYKIDFEISDSDGDLRTKLAEFYASRTLTNLPVRPIDIVEAGYYLITDKASRTTGHIIPIDGGLKEAFLR